ncbi:hypothetical protein GCM10011321_13200 [Youhaiella tibetensis]|nr:hypothetical protein [Youhaiella tibetensis]GGF23178.1 hypothetical protein GCM10011321_13200 [Youhaiella tibetensis]
MRYPLWAFLFLFMLPPFAVHALLTGKAEVASVRANQGVIVSAMLP